jgi:7-cyano-7-deazaguanine synthase
MSIVTLVSGGLDSTLMALLIKEENIEQYPLFINYGQLSFQHELSSLELNTKQFHLPKFRIFNLEGYGKLIKSGLTNKGKDIFYDAFLPNRNLFFIINASSYAYQVGANAVAIGFLNDTNPIFFDQTKNFIEKANQLVSLSLDYKIKFLTPLIKFTKQEVVHLAKAKGIENYYSCHKGGKKPCGKCIACKEYNFNKQ